MMNSCSTAMVKRNMFRSIKKKTSQKTRVHICFTMKKGTIFSQEPNPEAARNLYNRFLHMATMRTSLTRKSKYVQLSTFLFCYMLVLQSLITFFSSLNYFIYGYTMSFDFGNKPRFIPQRYKQKRNSESHEIGE